MKELIILLTLVIVYPTYAQDKDNWWQRLFGGGDSSGGSSRVEWDVILKDYYKYHPQFPSVRFPYNSFKIKDICHIPELGQLRTKKRVSDEYSYTDVVYESVECVDYHGSRCIKDIIIREHPLDYKVEVLGTPKGDRSFGPLLFKKPYQIKPCQD